ncbi:MAG TPA: acyltransferase, partial [Pseudomonas sp.]|nr:acyltransferase [Pseudomonas sp.]
SFWMDLVRPIRWDVQGLDQVDMHHSYLVTSNHQSWADILVLQYQLNRRMPFLKFFLKQELIWVPVIGLCWWA